MKKLLDEEIDFDNFSSYIEMFVKLVQSKIELCQSCDEVQVGGSYNDGITERGRDMLMYRQLSGEEDIKDFISEVLQFQDFDFDGMDLVDIIEAQLVCPKCGSGIIVNEVFTKRSIDEFWGGLSLEDINNLNHKYGTHITVEKLNQLKEGFIQNPLMLSYENAILRDFIKIINSINRDHEYEAIDISQELYRGRVFPEDTKVIKKTEFLEPPLLKSSHGRFNLMGESNVLYLAIGKDVIPYELNYSPSQGHLYVAKFKISDEIKLIDISSLFSELPKKLFFDNSIDGGYVKEKDILPNIFSACVKYCGFDGIIYNSVHLEHGEPRNVALFKSDKISYVSNECHEYNISYRDKNNA